MFDCLQLRDTTLKISTLLSSLVSNRHLYNSLYSLRFPSSNKVLLKKDTNDPKKEWSRIIIMELWVPMSILASALNHAPNKYF